MLNIKSKLSKYAFSSFCLSSFLLSASCATLGQKWKELVSGESSPPPQSRKNNSENSGPSFSSQPNMMVGQDRKYKRVTKDNFSEDQGLEDNVGSLWRKEGQGSYLFSQNNLRVIGDIINVNVEGKTSENLDTKLSIIKQALARLESPAQRGLLNGQQRAPASTAGAAPAPNGAAGKNAQANQGAVPPGAVQGVDGGPPQDQASGGQNSGAKEQEKMKYEPVPCRIVEKNADGSYRVKGQQTVYVGRHEYHLVVTGILHADDVSEGSISSGKLLDSKFDLLASNKEVKNDGH